MNDRENSRLGCREHHKTISMIMEYPDGRIGDLKRVCWASWAASA
jgi:hypothetical protein